MAVNFQPQHVWKPPGRSSRSCYQFSLHATSLSRHVTVCTALVCGGQCFMPVRLGHWQNQTSNICSGMTGQWSVRPHDVVTTRSNELLAWLGIEDLDLILKERLHWYGHVECSNGAVNTAFHIQVDGKCGSGRPKMTWMQLTERDCREWKLSATKPHDRNMWRSGVRSAVQQASYLEGGPLMWMLPLYLHVKQNIYIYNQDQIIWLEEN